MADPGRGGELEALIDRFGHVPARFDELGGYALDSRARESLAGLGFRRGDAQVEPALEERRDAGERDVVIESQRHRHGRRIRSELRAGHALALRRLARQRLGHLLPASLAPTDVSDVLDRLASHHRDVLHDRAALLVGRLHRSAAPAVLGRPLLDGPIDPPPTARSPWTWGSSRTSGHPRGSAWTRRAIGRTGSPGYAWLARTDDASLYR